MWKAFPFFNLTSQISNLKSQISNLQSRLSGLKGLSLAVPFAFLGLLVAPSFAAVPATLPAPAAPAARPAMVSGKVSAEEGKPLPEMIVYLEPANPAAAPSFAIPKEPVHVSQREAKFTPSLVVVCVGQAVDFRNDEVRPVEHNVFSRSPTKPFDLGLYRPGTGQKLVTFDKPGAVRLFCSIHRYMDGVIFVCPTPFYARVGADGTYRIENVPPGSWKLKTWQRNQRFNEKEIPLKLAEGQAAEQSFEMNRK
jgi:plastocyanin